MNNAEAVQQSIVDQILADAWLSQHKVASVAENRLDIEAEVARALDEVGICATVLTPEIDFMGDTEDGLPAGEIKALIVSVAESPANREQAEACTGLDAAMRIAQIVHSKTCQLVSIRQTADEAKGLLITNVTFATSVIIAITQEG